MTLGGLQPSPHWWGHTRKQQPDCATCLSKSSMAPTVLHHHNDKDPLNLAPFLCPHLSLFHHSKLYKAALPKVLRAFKLCTEDFHTTVQKLTDERSVKNGWDWRERETPGPLPTHGSTPTQIYSLSSAVSPIPIHMLHQVPASYGKNKSWRQMTGVCLHSSCLNTILS